MKESEKIVGIIGGMGPEATIDLQNRLIMHTTALDDIDHIRCLIDNNPKIPSRIKHIIEETGEDPGPFIAKMARNLEQWGADLLAMPCNTAHFYYDVINDAVDIPVLNLIELVVEHIENNILSEISIGVLGSTAIIKTGLYDKAFQKKGIKPVYPDDTHQDLLFSVIRKIKTGDTGTKVVNDFKMICKHLISKNVQTVIIACTELGIICSHDLPVKIIDASDVLAKEIIAIVKHNKQL